MMKLKKLLGYSCLLSAIATSGYAQMSPPLEIVDGDGNLYEVPASRYIIQYKSNKKSTMTSKISKMNGEVKRYIDEMNIVAAVLPQSEIQTLKQDPDVEFIEPDYRRYLMAEDIPYGIPLVQADQVSDENAANQKVCVIDSGYDIAHVDLPAAGVTGDDFGSATGAWDMPGDAHGTHVAGTIAAIGGNDEGVVGVLPGQNLPLHIVKIFNDNGVWTSASDLIAAVNDCVAAGSTVINMSLGGPSFSTSEDTAFTNAFNNGVISVAAAGNDGNASLSYPASYDNVISVGAVGSNRDHAGYSQFNYQVELAAPGTSVASTVPGNGYANFTGTSMASPHVAGVTALVWSHYPQCSAQEIRNTLAATAEDRGAAGRDDFYGMGIVQAKAAFDMLAQGCDTAPPLEIPGPPEQPEIDPELDNGELIEDIFAASGQFYRFYIDVPAGASNLEIVTTGGTGDADLYVSAGSEPTRSSFDCRSWSSTSDESCTFATPDATRYHVYLYAFSTFESVSLMASYEGDNQPPVPDFTYSCDGLTCDFDGTISTDSDGNIVKYFFRPEAGQPGYGTATATHTYTVAGEHNVGLSVTDDDGAKVAKRMLITVVDPDSVANVPPVAAITYSCNGLTCDFDGSSSSDFDGDIVSYSWRPEPGQPRTDGVSMSYTFAEAGTYSTRLWVTDDDGAIHGTRVFVTVEDPNSAPNVPPSASFTYSCNGLTCTFDGSSSSDTDGQIVSYYWKPERGQPAVGGVMPSYTYPGPGDYYVGLTVRDDDGARDGIRQWVTVE